MPEYRATFICRLCGERFEFSRTGNRSLAFAMSAQLAVSGVCKDVQAPSMVIPHSCKNGGVGIADFQGWDVVEP